MKTTFRKEFEKAFKACVNELRISKLENCDRAIEMFKLRFDFESTKLFSTFELRDKFNLDITNIKKILDEVIVKILSNGNKEELTFTHDFLELLNDGISEMPEELIGQKVFSFYILHFNDVDHNRVYELLTKLLSITEGENKNIYSVYAKARHKKPDKYKADRLKLEALNKIQEELVSYLDNVIWFKNTSKFSSLEKAGYKTMREINLEDEFIQGKYDSEKFKKNIQYESGLELKFIKRMERIPMVVEIIDQPLKLDLKINNNLYEYHPDFLIRLEDGRAFFVEIKPLDEMVLAKNQLKIVALAKYCQKEGMGILFSDGYQTLKQLVDFWHCPFLEEEIMDLISWYGSTEYSYHDFYEITSRHNAKSKDLASIVLKNRWTWHKFNIDIITPQTPSNEFYDIFVGSNGE